MNQKAHVYPFMTYEEVTESLHNWNIWVSQEQLASPTPDLVEGLYYACLTKALDVEEDKLTEPIAAIVSASEYPETLMSAASHNILMYHLKKFAAAAKVEDFNTADIARPHPGRNLEILAAFINYIKFIEHKTDNSLVELRGRSEGYLVERRRIAEAVRSVEGEIEDIKRNIDLTRPECQKLEEANTHLKATLMAKKERQSQALHQLEGIKSEKQENQQRKASTLPHNGRTPHSILNRTRQETIHAQVSALNDDISRYKSRIVQSPERIKRTISTMSTTAADDKQTLNDLEAKFRDLQVKSTALQGIEKDVRSCVDQLQMLEKEVDALSATRKELSEVKDSFELKTVERGEHLSRQERTNTQLSNAQERLDRAQRHAEEKRLAGQKMLERIKSEYEKVDVERKDNDREVESLREEAREIEARMAENLKQNEAELNDLLAVFWKLRHEADVYMDLLANELELDIPQQ